MMPLFASRSSPVLHPDVDNSGDDTIHFLNSAGNETVIVDNQGRMGIGTSSPSSPLHIVGNNPFPHLRIAAGATAPYGAFLSIDARATAGGKEYLIFSTGGGAGEGTGKLVFQDQTDGLDILTLTSAGRVGIGTLSPSYKLHVNGSVAGVGNYVNASDMRYKQNIATFENALEAILNLRGVTFDWNKESFKEMNFGDGKQVGFIAQEVEKVLPELVTTDDKGYKSVAYANVVPVLVEAIKTQQKQRVADKVEIAELKKRVEQLSVLVEKLVNNKQ